jgi:hypothetical protein
MKAYWSNSSERSLSSQRELTEVIGEVRRLGRPTMLFMESDGGTTLVLGIGGNQSVLTYMDAAGVTFHSVGDVSRNEVFQFWCRDQLDDFLMEMAVPESAAVVTTCSSSRRSISTGKHRRARGSTTGHSRKCKGRRS